MNNSYGPDRIIIKPTSIEEFHNLKKCCDVFFSPVVNKKCILSSPLTWIELLSTGVQIVMTSVPGTEKIIIPGQTGYLCRSSEELVLNLKQAINNYSIMRNYCNSMVNTNYNIEIITDSYLRLFNQRM